MAAMTSPRINLDEPRYDQNTFIGRAKHFFITTNPLNLLATPHQLDEAKNVVEKYRFGNTENTYFIFTAAGVVPCGGCTTPVSTSS